MSILKDTRCYLAGPVEHDKEASSWRQELAPKLLVMGIKVYDPLVKPPWFPSSCLIDPKHYRTVLNSHTQIMCDTIIGPRRTTHVDVAEVFNANKIMRKACLSIVHAVDWIICYLPIKFTSGTFEEIYEAINANKPVLFCCPDGIPSTWLLAASSTTKDYEEIFFNNWDSLLEHVLKIDKGQIKLDPFKWIFKTWRQEDSEGILIGDYDV